MQIIYSQIHEQWKKKINKKQKKSYNMVLLELWLSD